MLKQGRASAQSQATSSHLCDAIGLWGKRQGVSNVYCKDTTTTQVVPILRQGDEILIPVQALALLTKGSLQGARLQVSISIMLESVRGIHYSTMAYEILQHEKTLRLMRCKVLGQTW